MKRTLKYALTAVLGIGLVAPAFAQTDNFPDVPENHWAYEALARLKKDGLLVGYPDGLFRGPRPASRYELAVAIHAVYTNLRNVTDGLQSQIDALKNNPDVQALKDQMAALQNQVNAMKGWGDDIASLKKLADTFQSELHALGVDVDQLKKDLGDLARRVTALEAKKPAVDISGDVNLFLVAGNSSSGNPGLSTDGRLEGVFPTQTGNPGQITHAGTSAGLTEDLSVLQELAITFAGTNTTGPQWKGTIVYGDTLSSLGNQSTQNLVNGPEGQSSVGMAYSDQGTYGFYVQDLSVKFNTSVGGFGFTAEAGRIGEKVGPYLLQRVNPNSYFDNARWDNGEYYLDGADIAFHLLGGKVDVFGGRTSNQYSSDTINVNPLQVNNYGVVMGIDRTLGVTVNVPITSSGNLKVAYLWLDSDPVTGSTNATGNQWTQVTPYGATAAKSANALEVYGGTLDFALGVIKLEGDYAKSDLYLNNTSVNTSDDDSWRAKASYGTKTFDIYGFYREIGPNFAAPGDWGRIGIIRNPTNIKGETGGADINLGSSLRLSGDYEHEETLDIPTGGSSSKLDKYDISLAYKFSNALGLNVGYEDDKFSGGLAAGGNGDPEYKWTTFGLSYGLSDAAKLTLQYQLSDVSNDFVLPTNLSGGTYKGGLLTSQLTIKF